MYAPTVSRGNLNKKTISVLSKESSIAEKDRNITTNLAEERSIGNDLDVKSNDVRSGNRIINIDSDNNIDVENNILAKNKNHDNDKDNNKDSNNINSEDNNNNSNNSIRDGSDPGIDIDNEFKNNIQSNREFTISPNNSHRQHQRKKEIIFPFRDMHLLPVESQKPVSSSLPTSSQSTISKSSTGPGEALHNCHVVFDHLEYQPYPKRSLSKNENSMKCNFGDRYHTNHGRGSKNITDVNDKLAFGGRNDVSVLGMTDDNCHLKDMLVGNNNVNNINDFEKNGDDSSNNSNSDSNYDSHKNNNSKNKNDDNHGNTSSNILNNTDDENKTNEDDNEVEEDEILCDQRNKTTQQNNDHKKSLPQDPKIKNESQNGNQNGNESQIENGNQIENVEDSILNDKVTDSNSVASTEGGQKITTLGSMYQWMFFKNQDQTSSSTESTK